MTVSVSKRHVGMLSIAFFVFGPGNPLVAALWQEPLVSGSHRFVRVRIGQDGSIFALQKGGDLVIRHSADGAVLETLYIGSRDGVRIHSSMDFCLDTADEVHTLVFQTLNDPVVRFHSTILKSEEGGVTHTPVYLDRSMQAYHIEMDQEGNYYLLGVETNRHLEFSSNNSSLSSIHVIHKFSPEGTFLSSHCPLATGPSPEEYDLDVLDSVMGQSNFVVLPDGEMWYLHTIKKRNVPDPITDWPRYLYRVYPNGDGSALEVRLSPPRPSYQLFGIHKESSALMVEWIDADSPSQILITAYGDGRSLKTAPMLGIVNAVRDGIAVVSSGFGPGGPFELRSVQLDTEIH